MNLCPHMVSIHVNSKKLRILEKRFWKGENGAFGLLSFHSILGNYRKIMQTSVNFGFAEKLQEEIQKYNPVR